MFERIRDTFRDEGERRAAVIIIFAVLVAASVFMFDGVFNSVIAILFGILVVYAILHQFFGFNIFITKKETPKRTEVDITLAKDKKKKKDDKPKPQVFNIYQNIFDYDGAKSVCKAYGARLATYSEIESAYRAGANWCSYGWSAGQMALFPTQKSTYDKLQEIEGHEHDCGRPGINGGYMANPKLKFGANCFGIKPAITPKEEMWMKTEPHYPESEQTKKEKEQTAYWKKHLNDLLVAPFDYNSWSRY